MPSRRQVGEFSIKAITFTFTPGPAGSVLVQVNFEGTATGFGTVMGTMNACSAGQKSGTWDWCGVSYPADGESLTGSGEGTFSSAGANRWATQGLMYASDGSNYISEGELDLATRVWSGRLLAPD